MKTEQSTAPSVTTQSDTFDEINESISQTQKQTTSAPPITTSITSDSTIKTQEQTTSSTASAPPVTTSVTSKSTIKTREQTAAPTTAPASDDDTPEAQSNATDSPATNTLSADSVFTLPDGRTIKISDIERVILSTNSPYEPDPEVTDTEDIIRVLSAFNDMEFGEPYFGGWVGGNAIVIYSGGECFSQISFSDDEIFLVELIAQENVEDVYPIISGGLSYDEWKALFG